MTVYPFGLGPAGCNLADRYSHHYKALGMLAHRTVVTDEDERNPIAFYWLSTAQATGRVKCAARIPHV